MTTTKKKYDIGVVIGRFQVHDLHTAHKNVIQLMVDEVRNPLVFVGVAPALGTKEDPLDFTSRKHMIQEAFPTVSVYPLMDCPTNVEWSNNVDRLIRTIFPMGTVMLYGGRDSFVKSYKGDFKTYKIAMLGEDNGTDIRKEVGKTILDSAAFRAGVIYATQNQYPRTHMTVDIAFVDGNKVLMGRKQVRSLLCFPGGFVDPTDKSLEAAAERELKEETGLMNGRIATLNYIGSYHIDDWRYQKEAKIMTAFFKAKYAPCTWQDGRDDTRYVADDELADLTWVEMEHCKLTDIATHHHPLWNALLLSCKVKPKKATDTFDDLLEDEVLTTTVTKETKRARK